MYSYLSVVGSRAFQEEGRKSADFLQEHKRGELGFLEVFWQDFLELFLDNSCPALAYVSRPRQHTEDAGAKRKQRASSSNLTPRHAFLARPRPPRPRPRYSIA